MSLSKSRTITLIVAIATLTTNTFSTILFHQLPDDPYHLANNFGFYLHFANILSLFGFIGALRQHALSISIFANYLLLDTVICAIPRLLVLTLLDNLSSNICEPSLELARFSSSQQSSLPSLSTSYDLESSLFESITSSWSQAGCERIVLLAQLTLAAGVIAATILQLLGALWVREYAKGLWRKEVLEEARAVATLGRASICEDRGLPVIFEVADEEKL